MPTVEDKAGIGNFDSPAFVHNAELYVNPETGKAEKQEGKDGSKYVALQDGWYDAEFRTAYCSAGGDSAVVPNTSLSSTPTATNLIAWTNWGGVGKTLSLMAAADLAGTSTILGWWFTINAGSAAIALDRLREALDTATGKQVAEYLPAGTTIHADENKGSGILPCGMALVLTMDEPIADVYVVPVSSNATVVGNSVLTAIVS